ncbi:unnamed protein product [Chondrus crispus]|uniref:Uncharacterized protein n=1 Tax=Chondrus crispus TaxID=2769 RepID=R7QH45_CHOCR|nr:unnamed protein product [Chondrus crispus]CDF37394.1 unnamed protein product [Chondrus crispus]|eukprot:XP_005717213.1 unnamed protein product [Chondrus crispus]
MTITRHHRRYLALLSQLINRSAYRHLLPQILTPHFVSCAVSDERSGDTSPPQANDADYDCSSLDIAIFADGKQYLHATNDFHEEDNAEQGRPWSGNSERGEVACGVYNYYASFRDASEKLYPSVPPSFRSLKDLDPAVKAVLEYYTAAHLTLSESRCLFNLLAFLESSYPKAQRKLSIQFDNADRFSTYLYKARKRIVALEGWRTSVIHSDHGINKTGVFRPVFDLMIQEIKESGGIDSVLPFEKDCTTGVRRFSAPWY